MIFKNRGSQAGATVEHSHSQLIVGPVVPITIIEEMEGSEVYYRYRGRCIFEDIIHQELADESRIVLESSEFVVICPYASRFPFETWIIPRHHTSHFENIQRQGIEHLGSALKETLQRLEAALDDPAYNYVIHTAPFDMPEVAALSLAHRDHPPTDADCRLRVGERVLHQPRLAGRRSPSAAAGRPPRVRRQCRRPLLERLQVLQQVAQFDDGQPVFKLLRHHRHRLQGAGFDVDRRERDQLAVGRAEGGLPFVLVDDHPGVDRAGGRHAVPGGELWGDFLRGIQDRIEQLLSRQGGSDAGEVRPDPPAAAVDGVALVATRAVEVEEDAFSGLNSGEL